MYKGEGPELSGTRVDVLGFFGFKRLQGLGFEV